MAFLYPDLKPAFPRMILFFGGIVIKLTLRTLTLKRSSTDFLISNLLASFSTRKEYTPPEDKILAFSLTIGLINLDIIYFEKVSSKTLLASFGIIKNLFESRSDAFKFLASLRETFFKFRKALQVGASCLGRTTKTREWPTGILLKISRACLVFACGRIKLSMKSISPSFSFWERIVSTAFLFAFLLIFSL